MNFLFLQLESMLSVVRAKQVTMEVVANMVYIEEGIPYSLTLHSLWSYYNEIIMLKSFNRNQPL